MNRCRRHRGKRAFSARALTMIEAVLSIALVGLVLSAALNAVTTAQAGEFKVAEHSRGLLLAQDQMAEILEQAYADPNSGATGNIPNFGEGGVGDRSKRDDVGDYNGWSSSPPKHRDGTVMSELQGWGRSVEVVWVNPLNLSQTVFSNSGVKRITVTVTYNNAPVASLSAFRSSAWQGLREAAGGPTGGVEGGGSL